MIQVRYMAVYFDTLLRSALSWLGFFACHLRESINKRLPEGFKNIVIVQLGHMGDMLLTLSVIDALREQYPDARISIITGTNGEGVLKALARKIDVAVYESRKFGRTRLKNSVVPSLSGYDLIVHLRGDMALVREAFRNRGAVFISGLAVSNPVRWAPLYLLGIPFKTRSKSHQYTVFCEALSRIGVEMPQKPSLLKGRIKTESIKPFLQSHGLEKDSFAVIHAGAPWLPRRWPVERFAETARYLYAERGLPVILIGTAAERETAEYFTEHHIPFIDLVGALSLKQLASLLASCSLFIGNDSGPAHLAAAAGSRLIVLYGPQDPLLFGALSKTAVLVYNRSFCSPCWQRKCLYENSRCMCGIATDMVIREIEKICE